MFEDDKCQKKIEGTMFEQGERNCVLDRYISHGLCSGEEKSDDDDMMKLMSSGCAGAYAELILQHDGEQSDTVDGGKKKLRSLSWKNFHL